MKFITADNLKRFGTNVKKLVTDTKSGLETKIGTAQTAADTAKQAAATAQGAATDAKNNPNVKTINGKSIVGSGNLTLNDIGIDGNIVEIVTALPDLASAKSNKMYLVPVENSSEANNTYAEYVKINKNSKDSWEKLGEWKAEITVDSTLSDSTNPIQNKAVNTAVNSLKTRLSTAETNIGNKVDKVTGKQLSTNDYTTSEKNKLAGIAEGANKTVVDSTWSTSSTNPVENRVIKSELDKISTALGSKASKDVATQKTDGLLSAADKTKLDGLDNYTLSLETGDDTAPKYELVFKKGNKSHTIYLPLATPDTTNAAGLTTIGNKGLLSSSDKAKLDAITSVTDEEIDTLWANA